MGSCPLAVAWREDCQIKFIVFSSLCISDQLYRQYLGHRLKSFLVYLAMLGGHSRSRGGVAALALALALTWMGRSWGNLSPNF